MPPDIRGIDPADLRGIENGLKDISSKLDKPFAEMNERSRHEELLKTQNLHHRELLKENKEFNEKILSKYGDLNKWTKVLAIATLILMIGTIVIAILNFLSWNKNQELIDNQLELIDLQKKTLAPIIPELVITSDGDLKFGAYEFVRFRGYDKEGKWYY